MIEFESVKDHHPSWFCIWNNDDTTFNPYVLSKMFKIFLTWLSPKNHIYRTLFHFSFSYGRNWLLYVRGRVTLWELYLYKDLSVF